MVPVSVALVRRFARRRTEFADLRRAGRIAAWTMNRRLAEQLAFVTRSDRRRDAVSLEFLFAGFADPVSRPRRGQYAPDRDAGDAFVAQFADDAVFDHFGRRGGDGVAE